jgi:hypothetical protein
VCECPWMDLSRWARGGVQNRAPLIDIHQAVHLQSSPNAASGGQRRTEIDLSFKDAYRQVAITNNRWDGSGKGFGAPSITLDR